MFLGIFPPLSVSLCTFASSLRLIFVCTLVWSHAVESCSPISVVIFFFCSLLLLFVINHYFVEEPLIHFPGVLVCHMNENQ